MANPVGSYLIFSTSTPPDGYLECDGSAISRSTYSALFAVIGEMYGEGDSSTTFNIPDMRGKFPRAWAHGSANDPDRASRTDRGDGTEGDYVGTNQTHGLYAHVHAGNPSGSVASQGGVSAPSARSGGVTGASGGNETRPVNINMMYCIKY